MPKLQSSIFTPPASNQERGIFRKEEDCFLALQHLQTALQNAHSLKVLAEIVSLFLQTQLNADAVVVSAVENESLPHEQRFPLSQTGQYLVVHRQSPFDSQELAFLHMCAALAGSAPCCQQILQQNQQLLEELDLVQTVMTSAMALQPLAKTLEIIHQQITTLFHAPTCFIALHNPETRLITFPYVYEDEPKQRLTPLSSLEDASLTAWIISNNRPYMTGNWLVDDKPVMGVIEGKEPLSVLAVPIATAYDVVGVVSLQSSLENAFTEQDLYRLQAVANQVATIVHNAQLYEQARSLVEQSVHDYQTAVSLRQAIATIGTSLDTNVIARNLLLALGNLFNYDTAYVFMLEDDQWQLINRQDAYDRPITLPLPEIEALWQNSPLFAHIQSTKEPLIIPDAQTDPRWQSNSGDPQAQSWIGVPLASRGTFFGIMMATSHNPHNFGKHEAWLAMTLANQAAVALQNAQLHQRTEQQLHELGTLYQASAMMSANLDQDFVLQTVASEMVRATRVDSCTIFVWTHDDHQLVLAVHEKQPPRLAPEDHPEGLSSLQHLEQYPIIQQVLETKEIHSLRRDNAYSPHQIALLEASGLSSILLVPLIHRGNVLGLLALGQETHTHTFTPSELRLTQNLAGQAAVAIEHARLYSQSRRRIEELSTFHEIVLQLNTPLKLNAVLDSITEAALKLVEANNMHIYLYNADSNTFTFGSALWRDGTRKAAVSAPRSDGITMTVARLGKPVVVNDASRHPLFQAKETRAWGIHAIAGFPLKQDQQVIGVFTTTYLRPHTFREDELLLLNLLADQAAVAVKNARLYAQSQRQLRDMSALVDMAKQITSNLNLTSVLRTTVQIIQKLLSARASTITMLSKDGTELIVEAAAGISPEYIKARMKLGEGVSGEVVRRNAPIYIRDTHNEPDFLFFDEVVRSLLVVPLTIRDEAWGTMTVDSDQPNAFSRSDIQLMTIAAAQVSIAISNARLFEELEERATELAQAYEEIKESDRLKEELVQNVSHELRTPLTFVKGYVDLLLDGEMGLINKEQQEALQIVATKTDDISRIIADIMTLQRIDRNNLELEITSLVDLIRQSIAWHSMVAEKKGLSIETLLPETNPVAFIDKARFNQVLDNLIGNALKFSPNGGKVTITLQDESEKIQLSIADQGIGIPPDKVQRIFDRFYQVDGSSRRRFGGTGLGLAIVKRIVEAHYGIIWVESIVNEGSTFHIVLPKKATSSLA